MILKFNLKSILKSFKLNESTISMVLGAVVIVVVGVLIANYFKDKKAGSLPQNNGNKTEATINQTYLVAKGDNLWKIAEKTTGSGYNWVEIAKENNIENPSIINEGQELTIKVGGNLVVKEETQDISISGATYEVQKGDTLWSIAIRAYGDGYKWSEIARENKLVHPNIIHSGNILILPR
ncbi:MAG: LysM peptidoglycan-binding domain-containing protein [Candidatus Woesebacteria bacterium]|nr:LysM peptidoglycan-binding domain-containing protein [Candidatus Woesebacteria bacterium]